MQRSRSGFTLVELMVAMALTLFVMVILTQAFSLGVDVFTNAKGVGDMQQNLRAASVMIQSDLQLQHFEGDRKLSDWDPLNPTGQVVTQKIQAGFFAILQPNLPASGPAGALKTYRIEGSDPAPASMPSFRAVDHVLYMTIKRIGNRPHSFFTTTVPGTPAGIYVPPSNAAGFYSSQWAEVVYFLQRTGTTEQPNNATSTLAQTPTLGTPLFSLMRAEFVMAPDVTLWNSMSITAAAAPSFVGMSCIGTGATTQATQALTPNAASNLTFFSPADAAVGNRVMKAPLVRSINTNARNRNTTNSPGSEFPLFVRPNVAGITMPATLVLPNVISFQIQVMPLGTNAFQDLNATVAGVGTYDTTVLSPTSASLNNFGLKAIQVTMRIFEPKTRQTRQMTIVQDL